MDGISSQSPIDRLVALEYMRSRGAHLVTGSSLLFTLIEGADHPNFKAISKYVYPKE